MLLLLHQSETSGWAPTAKPSGRVSHPLVPPVTFPVPTICAGEREQGSHMWPAGMCSPGPGGNLPALIGLSGLQGGALGVPTWGWAAWNYPHSSQGGVKASASAPRNQTPGAQMCRPSHSGPDLQVCAGKHAHKLILL